MYILSCLGLSVSFFLFSSFFGNLFCREIVGFFFFGLFYSIVGLSFNKIVMIGKARPRVHTVPSFYILSKVHFKTEDTSDHGTAATSNLLRYMQPLSRQQALTSVSGVGH